jgi:hypothetical protein
VRISRRKFSIASGVDFTEWQHLDRTLAAHHRMDRFENLSHAALADPIGDGVGSQIQLGSAGL